jgi:hypothetical protein
MKETDIYKNQGLIHAGSKNSGSSNIMQYLKRVFSLEFFDNATGKIFNLSGSGYASETANRFSEQLKRDPHLKGMLKMTLLGIFPFLIFWLIAGKYKPMLLWTLAYFSISMWEPIWTLLYAIKTNIDLSRSLVSQFSHFSNGVSIHSARLINSKINYSFGVFSILQAVSGIAFSVILNWQIGKYLLSDKTEDSAPDVTKAAASTVTKGVF